MDQENKTIPQDQDAQHAEILKEISEIWARAPKPPRQFTREWWKRWVRGDPDGEPDVW